MTILRGGDMQDVWPCLVKVEEYLGNVLYMVVKFGLLWIRG